MALPKRLVVASHNAGKVREIGALLAPLNIEAISAASLNLAEPEETEDSFIGNARLKAVAAAQAANLPALADDSGLEVLALARAPGIYSARWAGPNRDFGLAMDKVLAQLADQQDRRARFVCALVLAQPDGTSVAFEGEVCGHICHDKRGGNGFGYDPIFIADGDKLSFGEIDPAIKHAKSHRAHAFAQLLDHFQAHS